MKDELKEELGKIIRDLANHVAFGSTPMSDVMFYISQLRMWIDENFIPIESLVGKSVSSGDVLLAELDERLQRVKLSLYELDNDTKHDLQEYHMEEGKMQLLIELIEFYSK